MVESPTTSTDNLFPYHITSAPDTVYYIPDFFSPPDSARLLSKIYTVPKPKWTTLRNRRLQNWGASVGDGSRPSLITETFPDWLESAAKRAVGFGLWKDSTGAPKVPNNCLINEYELGQGILPHEDGPAFHPAVATITLQAPCLLSLFRSQDFTQTPAHSFYLEPNSLFIITGSAYTDYLHGIAETEVDCFDAGAADNLHLTTLSGRTGELAIPRSDTRVSLTFRDAKRVARTNLGFLLKKK
ncbi:calpain [Phlyctochytrium arcticum]|nr:calpain [Phlyctochytrium arcticum]